MQGILYLGPKRGGGGLCGQSPEDTKAPPTAKDQRRDTKSASVESKESKGEKDGAAATTAPSGTKTLSAPRPSTTARGSIHVQRSSLTGMVELTAEQQTERLKESNKVKYWNCRLHRLILHRYVSTSGEKRAKKYKYVDATQDYPIAIDQLVGVTATPQINPNKPSKIYLEFSDGSEFKCKIDSMDEFNVWFDLLKIFIEYHQQLPHTGLKYTYKAYPIPSLYKTALIDCFNYIRENGVHEEGIFRAGKTDVQQLREIIIGGGLDASKSHDVLGVAFVCKSILRSLPETILTNYLLPHFMDAARQRNMNDLITCIRDLPADNREILQLLLETCILCCQSATSKMTVESMAKVVGPNFLDTEDPALLMQIKTGELPLIQLFDMMMYNMRQVFGEGAITMPKKRKNAELGLSPKMDPASSPAEVDSAIVFVDEKKSEGKDAQKNEKSPEQDEIDKLEHELREKERAEKEQKEKEKKERERREKELLEKEKEKQERAQREQQLREKEQKEREQREREQREKEEREEKAKKEEEERKRAEAEKREREKEAASRKEELEMEESQRKAVEAEAEAEAASAPSESDSSSSPLTSSSSSASSSVPPFVSPTPIDPSETSPRIASDPIFHSLEDTEETVRLNVNVGDSELTAEISDAPVSSPVGFTLHTGDPDAGGE